MFVLRDVNISSDYKYLRVVIIVTDPLRVVTHVRVLWYLGIETSGPKQSPSVRSRRALLPGVLAHLKLKNKRWPTLGRCTTVMAGVFSNPSLGRGIFPEA